MEGLNGYHRVGDGFFVRIADNTLTALGITNHPFTTTPSSFQSAPVLPPSFVARNGQERLNGGVGFFFIPAVKCLPGLNNTKGTKGFVMEGGGGLLI